MGSLWSAVALAVRPFMAAQHSKGHFEFFGIDVIADAERNCWLIELNRLPGLGVSFKVSN